MTEIARKIAMVRSAAQEIGRAEKVLADPKSPKWKRAVEATVDAANKGRGWCEEMVAILSDVRHKVEGYQREL